jgi:hypothetical protein
VSSGSITLSLGRPFTSGYLSVEWSLLLLEMDRHGKGEYIEHGDPSFKGGKWVERARTWKWYPSTTRVRRCWYAPWIKREVHEVSGYRSISVYFAPLGELRDNLSVNWEAYGCDQGSMEKLAKTLAEAFYKRINK